MKLPEIKGMERRWPPRIDGVAVILDKEGNKYYSQKQLADGAWNEAIDKISDIEIEFDRYKVCKIIEERLRAYGLTQSEYEDLHIDIFKALCSHAKEIVKVKE